MTTSCLKDHSKKLLAKLIELQDKEIHCDVILLANDGKTRIPAHRNLLSANSDYFKTIFFNAYSATKERVVEIVDLETNILKQLVDYCYTGKIQVDESNIIALFEGATIWKMAALENDLTVFILNELNIYNCWDRFKWGLQLTNKKVQTDLKAFICREFMECTKTPRFLELEADLLTLFLENENLNITFEEELFNCLIEWMNYDAPDRKHLLPKLLSMIKLPHISATFLLKHMDNLCETSQNLVHSAINYYSSKKIERSTLPSHWDIERNPNQRLIVARKEKRSPTEIVEYNFESGEWTPLFELMDARNECGIIHMRGNIYFAGGWLDKDLTEVLQYNLRTKQWSKTNPLCTAGRLTKMVVVNHSLYAVEHCNVNGAKNSIERLNVTTGEWQLVTTVPKPKVISGVTTLHGRIFCAGGMEDGIEPYLVDVYDTATNEWSCIPMTFYRQSFALLGFGDDLVFIGGGPNNVERYNFKTKESSKCIVRLSGRVKWCINLKSKLFAIGNDFALESSNYNTTWTKNSSIKLLQGTIVAVLVIPSRYFHEEWRGERAQV